MDKKTVIALTMSLREIGQQTPISVRRVDKLNTPDTGDCSLVLVAGAHRLAAAKMLQWEFIDCVFFDGDDRDARMWEISENLHRAELTPQERADHVAEWIRLQRERQVSAQVEPKPNGGRPQGGINAAARELGIPRSEAQRAVKVASLTADARVIAEVAGIKTQAELLSIASFPPAEQAAEAMKIVARKADRARRAQEKRDPKTKIDAEIRALVQFNTEVCQSTHSEISSLKREKFAVADMLETAAAERDALAEQAERRDAFPITAALDAITASAPPDDILSGFDSTVVGKLRNLVPIAIAWLENCRAALEKLPAHPPENGA